MRRKLLFMITILVIITVGCLSGCGGCGCEDEHDATYEQWHEDTQQDTGHSTSTNLPSEADMGVPVYDDNVVHTSVESSETKTDGEFVEGGVDYDTTDDFETVVSWYKHELGEPDEIQQLPNGNNQAWWNLSKDGMYIQVIVTCTGEGCAISILKAKE